MAVLQARVRGVEQFVEMLEAAFIGEPLEGLVVAGLGIDGDLCGVAVNSRHRSLSFVKVWELSDLAAELEAWGLVVAVFPGGRARRPSDYELATFRDLDARTRRAGVVLIDCYVDRGNRLWSLRDLTKARAGA
jgi:hypothetical protein